MSCVCMTAYNKNNNNVIIVIIVIISFPQFYSMPALLKLALVHYSRDLKIIQRFRQSL